MLLNVGNTAVPLSLIVCIALLASSCSSYLSERVRAYEATYNTHDVEKLMSFYADDVEFEIVGVWVKKGKAVVRELAEWDKATNMHMTISDITVSGDTVTCKLVETNDWWRLAGMGEAYYEPCVMIFHNGLISEMRATMTQESLDAYARVWPSIISWARDHRSEELNELLPGGLFVYGAEAANKWIMLLQEWRAAKEQ
jgi:hypothetical protein